MFEVLLWGSGLVIVGAIAVVVVMTKDPMHPLMYLGPMMFYVYVLVPGVLFRRGLIDTFFPEERMLDLPQFFIFAGIVAFCAGALQHVRRGGRPALFRQLFVLTPEGRKRLFRLSVALGLIGVSAYAFMLSTRGGLLAAFSSPKGGGWAPTGYVAAAPLLTIPAIMLMFLSRQKSKLLIKHWFLVAVFATPYMIQGALGGSRGPAFLILSGITFGWYLSRTKRPSILWVLMLVGALGLVLLFLKSQRQQIYVGADFELDKEAFVTTVLPQEIDRGHTSVYSWGLITASMKNDHHLWGRRYGAQLFVRPIPRQIWPTKYDDVGLTWMVEAPGTGGMTPHEWISSVGWEPQAGSAAGFVADSFLEFSWAGLAICYLVGLTYSTLWRRALLYRGLWSIVYLEAVCVSVYVPTQNVTSAWMYRLLYLAIPTIVLWKWQISRHETLLRRAKAPAGGAGEGEAMAKGSTGLRRPPRGPRSIPRGRGPQR